MHGPITLAALALALTLADGPQKGQEPPPVVEEPAATSAWEFLTDKYDADGDGIITRKEYGGPKDRWAQLDRNGDGKIDQAEIEKRGRVDRPNPGKKRPKAPVEGKKAPLFELEILEDVGDLPKSEGKDGKKDPKKRDGDGEKGDAGSKGDKQKKERPRTVSLADFRGEKPVALIFGSYT